MRNEKTAAKAPRGQNGKAETAQLDIDGGVAYTGNTGVQLSQVISQVKYTLLMYTEKSAQLRKALFFSSPLFCPIQSENIPLWLCTVSSAYLKLFCGRLLLFLFGQCNCQDTVFVLGVDTLAAAGGNVEAAAVRAGGTLPADIIAIFVAVLFLCAVLSGDRQVVPVQIKAYILLVKAGQLAFQHILITIVTYVGSAARYGRAAEETVLEVTECVENIVALSLKRCKHIHFVVLLIFVRRLSLPCLYIIPVL